MENNYEFQNPSQEDIFSYLREAKNIAVIGLSSREETSAYMVAKALQESGYRIIPVNPKLAGEILLGEQVYASVLEIPFHVDIVNVFRRSEFLAEVAADFLQTDADVFWAQQGLQSEEAEQILRAAGREKIVMNRCIKIEHVYSGLGKK